MASLLACVTAGAQQIPNGGFEQDLTDWDTGGDRNMSLAVAEAAHSGKFGLRVTDESDRLGSSITSLPTEVVPGARYELGCWSRGVSGTGGVGIYFRFLNENGKALGKDKNITLPADSKEWKRYAVSATAPEGAVSAVVWIHSYAKDMPVVDLDDFELKTISTE